MLVRLPSAEPYAAKVKIEQEWLPKLAPHLSLKIPTPIAMGNPSSNYPWHWSIYKWIDGDSANTVTKEKLDLNAIAKQLAQFLNELHKINTTNAPPSGKHNFYRGGDLAIYDNETKSAIIKLHNIINTNAATATWEKALNSKWQNPPVWVHGDLSSGNILTKNNKLMQS